MACQGRPGSCEKRDSNPHGVTRWNLNPVRLPIPPSSHASPSSPRRDPVNPDQESAPLGTPVGWCSQPEIASPHANRPHKHLAGAPGTGTPLKTGGLLLPPSPGGACPLWRLPLSLRRGTGDRHPPQDGRPVAPPFAGGCLSPLASSPQPSPGHRGQAPPSRRAACCSPLRRGVPVPLWPLRPGCQSPLDAVCPVIARPTPC